MLVEVSRLSTVAWQFVLCFYYYGNFTFFGSCQCSSGLSEQLTYCVTIMSLSFFCWQL